MDAVIIIVKVARSLLRPLCCRLLRELSQVPLESREKPLNLLPLPLLLNESSPLFNLGLPLFARLASPDLFRGRCWCCLDRTACRGRDAAYLDFRACLFGLGTGGEEFSLLFGSELGVGGELVETGALGPDWETARG